MNYFYYNNGESTEPLQHTVQRGSFYSANVPLLTSALGYQYLYIITALVMVVALGLYHVWIKKYTPLEMQLYGDLICESFPSQIQIKP